MRWLSILFAIVVAACAPPASPLRETIVQQLAGRSPGPARACIPAESDRNLVAADPETIIYDVGHTVYVNRLAGPCPGLKPLSTIIVLGSSGGQYCRNDRIRGREQGSVVPGPSCNLGEWIPYRR